MVSSLAAQLSQNVSLNSSLLLEKSRRKPGESYLFTGRDADQHDLESVHALGVNGFLQLVSLNSALRVYEKHLFSGSVKDVDRTLLTKEEDMQLDEQIAGFLRAIGPYLLEGAAGKVIEWLVRRFRSGSDPLTSYYFTYLHLSELMSSISKTFSHYFCPIMSHHTLPRWSLFCTSSPSFITPFRLSQI